MSAFLQFHDHGPSKSGKTRVWGIWSGQPGGYIGEVRWHAHWRRYAFFPNDGTLWDAGCLREVVAFIDEQMEARR